MAHGFFLVFSGSILMGVIFFVSFVSILSSFFGFSVTLRSLVLGSLVLGSLVLGFSCVLSELFSSGSSIFSVFITSRSTSPVGDDGLYICFGIPCMALAICFISPLVITLGFFVVGFLLALVESYNTLGGGGTSLSLSFSFSVKSWSVSILSVSLLSLLAGSIILSPIGSVSSSLTSLMFSLFILK